jgi:dihydrofolate reductase
MSKIVVVNNLTLDGVMQGPGRADEDTRDGFTQGGWAQKYADDVAGKVMSQHMAGTRALLLGRRTYVDFSAFWQGQGADNPFTQVLTNTTKYVASNTLPAQQAWANTTVLPGDATDAIADLRAEPGKDIVVLGSGELVRSLIRHDLIDEYLLLMHPLVLGHGRRLFTTDLQADLTLVDSVPTTTGVLVLTYSHHRDS